MKSNALNKVKVPSPFKAKDQSEPGDASFPAELSVIGRSAFENCALKFAEMPYSLNRIGKNAFDKNVCIKAHDGSCGMWYANANGMEYEEDYYCFIDD